MTDSKSKPIRLQTIDTSLSFQDQRFSKIAELLAEKGVSLDGQDNLFYHDQLQQYDEKKLEYKLVWFSAIINKEKIEELVMTDDPWQYAFQLQQLGKLYQEHPTLPGPKLAVTSRRRGPIVEYFFRLNGYTVERGL